MIKPPMLINSCDRYHFLWSLCINRIESFGFSDVVGEVFINNETLRNSVNANFISCQRGERVFPINNWIIHLRSALECIQHEFVVITQDDYLLTSQINSTNFSQALSALSNFPELSCVHLSNNNKRQCEDADNYSGLYGFAPLKFSKYFLNMQIAIWRRSDLIEALVGDGNPWKWELSGHKRLRRRMNIIAPLDGHISVEYFALVKKGKLLADCKNHLRETEYLDLASNLDIYRSSYIKKFGTFIKAYLI